jgi:hypothetical protein
MSSPSRRICAHDSILTIAIHTSCGSPESGPRRHVGWLPFVGAIDGSGPGRRGPNGGGACAASPAKNTGPWRSRSTTRRREVVDPFRGRLTRRRLRPAPRTARSGPGCCQRTTQRCAWAPPRRREDEHHVPGFQHSAGPRRGCRGQHVPGTRASRPSGAGRMAPRDSSGPPGGQPRVVFFFSFTVTGGRAGA